MATEKGMPFVNFFSAHWILWSRVPSPGRWVQTSRPPVRIGAFYWVFRNHLGKTAFVQPEGPFWAENEKATNELSGTRISVKRAVVGDSFGEARTAGMKRRRSSLRL